MKIFPIDPHCKNRRVSATSSYVCILTSKVDGILQWGSMGKVFTCSRIQMKFGLRVKDRGEFEFDRARSKNNIAKNPKNRLHCLLKRTNIYALYA